MTGAPSGRLPALALGLALLVFAGAAAGQPAAAPELRAEAGRLFRQLAGLRGVAVAGAPPPILIRGREDRRRFVAAELARKYSPARLDAERQSVVAWGLAPPDFDLAAFLADLMAEQAAAYYDPVAKRMIMANWLTPELRRDALTHELVHALQDRLLDLDRFLTSTRGSDEGLARQALIEGEAVALSYDLRLRREGGDLARLPDVATLQAAIRASASGPMLARAPRYLRATLTFPYAAGAGFTHAFRQRRPWSAFSALYADPPRSTAQILHPERYLDRREDPVRIDLPDLRPLLPGAIRLIEDDLGELGLGEVLRQFLGDAAAAAGWRGDRYVLWRTGAEHPMLAAITAWDREATARNFANAYARVIAAKHGLPPPPGDAATDGWPGAGPGLTVERRGRVVILVEHAPPEALGAVLAALRAATAMLY
jgi:hypothetical protein